MKTKCGIGFSCSLLHPRYWLTWLGLMFFFLISLFPTSWRHSLGRKVGEIIYRRNEKRRHTAKTNLKIAFPELNHKQLSDLILAHFQSHGCALVDYSVLFFASKQRLSNMVEIQGKENVDAAIKSDGGVIILLAHSVMLEFAPVALGLQYDCFGSYKTFKNAVMNWLIVRSRCRHVQFVVSREEGLRKLVKSSTVDNVMIFLPDEDLGEKNAVFAPFFDAQKSTLATTARIAKLSKAVALPTFVYFDDEKSKYIVQVGQALENYPSADAIADAGNMNKGLENLINQNPKQYMWAMKWYRTRPQGEKAIY